MSSRYWVAVLGAWLGVPLALAAGAVAVSDAQLGLRIFAALAVYLFGFGAHHFQSVGDAEFRKRFPHD